MPHIYSRSPVYIAFASLGWRNIVDLLEDCVKIAAWSELNREYSLCVKFLCVNSQSWYLSLMCFSPTHGFVRDLWMWMFPDPWLLLRAFSCEIENVFTSLENPKTWMWKSSHYICWHTRLLVFRHNVSFHRRCRDIGSSIHEGTVCITSIVACEGALFCMPNTTQHIWLAWRYSHPVVISLHEIYN